MRLFVAMLACAVLVTERAAAIDRDLTLEQIESALSIARGMEGARAAFHASYVRTLNTPLVERVEIVSEFRRLVLLAVERAQKGDRMFGYSASQAQKAVGAWNRRLSVVARLRFHPQNTYVAVPEVDIALDAPNADRARIGVLKEPIMSLPSPKPNDRLPVLGAVVEGVFDASQIFDGTRTFIVRLEGKEIARASFDLGILH